MKSSERYIAMITNHHLLEEMEREFLTREKLPYRKAIRLVEALWKEGVHFGTLPPPDPSEGLEVDLTIARVLNSCSRNSSPV